MRESFPHLKHVLKCFPEPELQSFLCLSFPIVAGGDAIYPHHSGTVRSHWSDAHNVLGKNAINFSKGLNCLTLILIGFIRNLQCVVVFFFSLQSVSVLDFFTGKVKMHQESSRITKCSTPASWRLIILVCPLLLQWLFQRFPLTSAAKWACLKVTAWECMFKHVYECIYFPSSPLFLPPARWC